MHILRLAAGSWCFCAAAVQRRLRAFTHIGSCLSSATSIRAFATMRSQQSVMQPAHVRTPHPS
jgi:hypothetical protein